MKAARPLSPASVTGPLCRISREALERCEAAPARRPEEPGPWIAAGPAERAWLLERLGRREEAIACFREEVRLDHRRFFDLQPEIRRLLDEPAG